MKAIQLRHAKAKLSAVVDEALAGKPSVITRRGKRQAVVVGYDEWRKLSKVPSFGWLLAHMPTEVPIVRSKSTLRTTRF